MSSPIFQGYQIQRMSYSRAKDKRLIVVVDSDTKMASLLNPPRRQNAPAWGAVHVHLVKASSTWPSTVLAILAQMKAWSDAKEENQVLHFVVALMPEHGALVLGTELRFHRLRHLDIDVTVVVPLFVRNGISNIHLHFCHGMLALEPLPISNTSATGDGCKSARVTGFTGAIWWGYGGTMCTGDRYVVRGLVAKWAPDGNTMCYILDAPEDVNAHPSIVVRSATHVGKALNTRNARAVAWQADLDGNTHHRAKKRSWQE